MAERKYYELIPPQEMIQFMLKYSFFHKQVTQIPASVIVKRKIDFELMKKALAIEGRRNDCMRLRFKKQGGKTMQCFLDEWVPLDVPVLTFKTKEEQERVLNEDAGKTIHYLKDETMRIMFFNSFDGRWGIYINVSHLVMDAAAVFVFFGDLLAVYDSLETGAPMPKALGTYEAVVKKELAYIHDEKRVNADKEWYREFFLEHGDPIYNGVHGPELLEKERKKKKNPDLRVTTCFDPIHDKALLTKRPVSAEDSKPILDFMESTGVSPECLMQLGMRIHVGKINYRQTDTYFVTLCTRRRTYADKRCGGTTAVPLPWLIRMSEETKFGEALDMLKELQGKMYRHMDYPFIQWRDLENELFHYSSAAASSSMMFSWFPLEEGTMSGWDYEFSGYSIGRYVMPLYSYTMKDAHTGNLKFAYLHRTNLISVENIDALHNNTIKALKLGCENPGLTIGEIMDKLN